MHAEKRVLPPKRRIKHSKKKAAFPGGKYMSGISTTTMAVISVNSGDTAHSEIFEQYSATFSVSYPLIVGGECLRNEKRMKCSSNNLTGRGMLQFFSLFSLQVYCSRKLVIMLFCGTSPYAKFHIY